MALRNEPEGRDQSVEQFSGAGDIPRDLDTPPVLARETLIYRAGKFVRRNKVATAAAALLLLSLLGGVFATAWQARKLAKANAERRFNNVRQLERSDLIDYGNSFSDLPGATRMQVKDAPASDVRSDFAELRNDVGSAIEGQGDTARKAPPAYERSVADTPTDRTYRQSVSVAYANPGGVSFLTGGNLDALNLNDGDYLDRTKRPQAALEAFRMKLALAEQLVAANPDNAQVQANVAYVSSRIADVLVELGDPTDALPYYQRAVDIYERNAATQPDLAVSLQLSQLLGKLAKTHAKLGYIAKARAECSKAADLLQTIPDDAGNLEQRRIRALAYAEIGDAYVLIARDTRTPQRLLTESWRAARDMYQRSLEILQDLRDQGVLNSDEVAEIDAITQKIAECDLFLVK